MIQANIYKTLQNLFMLFGIFFIPLYADTAKYEAISLKRF